MPLRTGILSKVCHTCYKICKFLRIRPRSSSDVLSRHAARCNYTSLQLPGPLRSGPKSRSRKRRACDRCVHDKTRCDKIHPCKRCSSKNLECFYTRDETLDLSSPGDHDVSNSLQTIDHENLSQNSPNGVHVPPEGLQPMEQLDLTPNLQQVLAPDLMTIEWRN